MSEITTDEIYRKITEKAIMAEKDRIEKILWAAYSAIGLGGTCINVELRDNKDNKPFNAYSNTMIQSIADARISEVKEGIAKKAVDDFIESVGTFKKHLATIESYQLLSSDNEE